MTASPFPEYPTVVFGDGQMGQMIKMRPCGKNQEGVDMTELKIRPSPKMIYFYGVDEEKDLDEYGCLIRKFPSFYVRHLGRDPMTGTVLVLCDYNWYKTNLTERYPALETLEDYQKQNLTLKKQNARLHYDIQMLMTNQTKYFRNVADMAEQVKRVGKRGPNEGQEMPEEALDGGPYG